MKLAGGGEHYEQHGARRTKDRSGSILVPCSIQGGQHRWGRDRSCHYTSLSVTNTEGDKITGCSPSKDEMCADMGTLWGTGVRAGEKERIVNLNSQLGTQSRPGIRRNHQ